MQYPLDETRFTMAHGHLFRAWSNLRVITNNLGFVTYSGHGPAVIPADDYFDFHEQLEIWFTSLPTALQPENIIWPSQFNLQYVHVPLLRRLSWACVGSFPNRPRSYSMAIL